MVEAAAACAATVATLVQADSTLKNAQRLKCQTRSYHRITLTHTGPSLRIDAAADRSFCDLDVEPTQNRERQREREAARRVYD